MINESILGHRCNAFSKSDTVNTQNNAVPEARTATTQSNALPQVHIINTQSNTVPEVHTVNTQSNALPEVHTVNTQSLNALPEVHTQSRELPESGAVDTGHKETRQSWKISQSLHDEQRHHLEHNKHLSDRLTSPDT